MGRRAEGWKLREKFGGWYVRFTHNGRRYEINTERKDSPAAAARAAEIYAGVVNGKIVIAPSRTDQAEDLAVLLAFWIDDLMKLGAKRVKTAEVYRVYTLKWVRRWNTIRDITTRAVAQYVRDGLTRALAKTIKKEISALFGSFFEWAIEHEYITRAELPEYPTELLASSDGTRTGKQKRHRTEVPPAELEAFLDRVPEWGGKGANRWRARDALIVQYDTSLRPSTVGRLSVPENYVLGATELDVEPEIDKVGFGRKLPLTPRAQAALERSAPAHGVIFGEHDYREIFARVGARFSIYDIRHAAAQHLVDSGAPLPAAAWMLGHKSLTTTDVYARASIDAARKALAERNKGQNSGQRKNRRKARTPDSSTISTGAKEGT